MSHGYKNTVHVSTYRLILVDLNGTKALSFARCKGARQRLSANAQIGEVLFGYSAIRGKCLPIIRINGALVTFWQIARHLYQTQNCRVISGLPTIQELSYVAPPTLRAARYPQGRFSRR
jgi:hypothetical protein